MPVANNFTTQEDRKENITHSIQKRPLWRMLFFIGHSPYAKVRKRVEEEARVFEDVVLLPYQEGYYNLTLKTLAMFQWASQHVKASFVFKADDDV